MRNAFVAILLALFTAGCGAQNQPTLESNINFADRDMAVALEKESAFCAAVSRGEKNVYAHVANAPERGFKSSFSLGVNALGYTDRLGQPKKQRADYVKAVRAFHPASASGPAEERAESCLRFLGWKTKAEVNGRDRLQIDKNNRSVALLDKIRRDPLSAKSMKIMSANMDRLSYRQAQDEKKKLFADPSIFEQVYMRARTYVQRNGKQANSRILASSIGVDFARCSAMYSVINQSRMTKMQQQIGGSDRLLAMERESFYYASRLMHVDAAQREKRAYAKRFQSESGPNLSGLMLRFKEESSQCATMIQGFKRIDFSANAR